MPYSPSAGYSEGCPQGKGEMGVRTLLVCIAMLFASAGQAADWLYLTEPGDTLIGIGKRYLKNPNDWPKVQSANNVPIPKKLPAHSRLKIPVTLLKVTPAAVRVTHVEGNVRVKPADGDYRKLAVGDQLTGGETVLTGPRSFASFKLADDSTISQQPTSRLVFGRLQSYGLTGMVSTELDLQGGRLEANASRQLAPAGGLRVKTPVAVAGLRGTAFRLNVDEAGQTLRSEVLEGQVGVASQGKEVGVAAGQGTIAAAGAPPARPRPLLPAPSGRGLADKIVALPLRFAWQADAGARAWRTQVAVDAAFTKIYLEALSDAQEAQWDTALPDGHYVLRLRGVDADGLEGLNLDHPFELDVRPLPPTLASPGEGERNYREQVQFAWSVPEEAHGYVLQLSPDAGFSGEIVERRLDAITRHQETLSPGHWHWRMASLDERGEQHLWGPSRAFKVQPLPAAPGGGEAKADSGKAYFAWLAVAGAARYEMELGKDAQLGAGAQRQAYTATQAALELAPGKYFWRVRGLEADGQAGAWSQASPVVMPPHAPTHLQAKVTDDALQASWQGQAPAYRLELASDTAFKQIVARGQASGQSAQIGKPEPGNYWLRVVALDEAGTESPPSPPLAVEVKRGFPWWLLPLLLLPFAG